MYETLERGIDHIVTSAMKTLSSDGPGIAREDVRRLLDRLNCTGYINGGTFGSVFSVLPRTPGGDDERVVKIVPGDSHKGLVPSGALREYKLQKLFAKVDLAWRPHKFRTFEVGLGSRSDEASPPPASLKMHVISMPRIPQIFDHVLRTNVGRWETTSCKAIGRDLAVLLQTALDRGLVHCDAKCNNIGITRSGTLRFLDFGKSFDRKLLKNKGYSKEAVEEALRLGTAWDAWRLLCSVVRCVRTALRREDEERVSAVITHIAESLRTLCVTLAPKHARLQLSSISLEGDAFDGRSMSDTLRNALLATLRLGGHGSVERRSVVQEREESPKL
jgi:hypothetical protein